MREEEESIFFPRWEGEELPSPEELMPISQTLITPHLALAFDIRNPNPSPPHQQQQLQSHPLPIVLSPPPSQLQSSEFESADLGSGNPGGDEPARTLKRPRLVWTPQLHKRFVDAVAHLGIKNAVPKTIMQLMSVDGLTRENVASHLQKYRLYLKRMRELPPGGGGGAPLSAADAATDHLFATSHVPHHFLHPVLPYVPVTAQHHHHHHQQIAAVAAGQQQQQQQFHHLQVGQFEPGFLSRAQPIHRMGGSVQAQGFAEDLESGPGGRGRRVLTLFPTGDN